MQPPAESQPTVDPRSVRILIDEDLPPDLSGHLRQRGCLSDHINELREAVWGGKPRIEDDDVCAEAARMPSVLVALNIRDYSDFAFVQRLAEVYGVSVVIVRPPKRESGQGRRPQAIRDIVHRHAHKIGSLYDVQKAIVVSANRGSFRKRPLSEIVEVRRARR